MITCRITGSCLFLSPGDVLLFDVCLAFVLYSLHIYSTADYAVLSMDAYRNPTTPPAPWQEICSAHKFIGFLIFIIKPEKDITENRQWSPIYDLHK